MESVWDLADVEYYDYARLKCLALGMSWSEFCEDVGDVRFVEG